MAKLACRHGNSSADHNSHTSVGMPGASTMLDPMYTLCILLIYIQSTHVEVSIIQLADRLLGSTRVQHGHKGKATGAATLTVLRDEGILHIQKYAPEGKIS